MIFRRWLGGNLALELFPDVGTLQRELVDQGQFFSIGGQF
jgi:hypothetical protein